MKQKIKLLSIVLILSVLTVVNTPFFVFGQNDDNPEIKGLNQDIQDKKSEIKKIQEQQEKYDQLIKAKQAESASLNNQLAILDNRIAKAELDIEIKQTEIERTKLEIQKTDIEIENKNQEIKEEKENISDVLRLLYKKDSVTPLEIMLVNDSLADFLSQVKYLEDVNEDLGESLKTLEKLSRQLEMEKENLNSQKIALEAQEKELEDNRAKLASEIESKSYVLTQTKNSEKQYQRLLAQAKEEQQAVATEITVLEKQVRAKLAQLEGKKLELNSNGFIWPVTKNTITAYFHDPDYPFRNVFEHPAVDIRAGQGTPLKAVASGYVARTKYGAGGSYGYIMLVHGDGLSTVYGHVSKIYVEEDDYVVQGQTIGLSGGLPGTPGAGGLTTGPHLHFEVRLDGIPVNPLGYLP